MIEKNVEFIKFDSQAEKGHQETKMTGRIMDKFSDNRVKDNKLITTEYYLIATENGELHQVRPFNVVKIIQ